MRSERNRPVRAKRRLRVEPRSTRLSESGFDQGGNALPFREAFLERICVCVYIYVSLSLSIYIYIYVYMCIYIYIYTYTYYTYCYIHTYAFLERPLLRAHPRDLDFGLDKVTSSGPSPGSFIRCYSMT